MAVCFLHPVFTVPVTKYRYISHCQSFMRSMYLIELCSGLAHKIDSGVCFCTSSHYYPWDNKTVQNIYTESSASQQTSSFLKVQAVLCQLCCYRKLQYKFCTANTSASEAAGKPSCRSCPRVHSAPLQDNEIGASAAHAT